MKGVFINFECVSKSGKTTIANGVTRVLGGPEEEVLYKRGSLSIAEFSGKYETLKIKNLGYSAAFYWTDTVFDTLDCIVPLLEASKIIIQEMLKRSINE